MTTTVELKDLPERFAELLAMASEGDEVLVTEQGTPKAVLLPLPPRKTRVAGLHLGAIQAGDDFDSPLPDDFWAGLP